MRKFSDISKGRQKIYLSKIINLRGCISFIIVNSGVRRKKIRGVQDYGRPRRGSGGFSKICKKFLKKIAKNPVFLSILQKDSKPCVKFSRVWTKNTIGWGNFEKIVRFFDENAIEKWNF